ncbi:DUF2785 domain-containing protein [Micromonospora musae]|uniref:DUF2785 domain-containing protein n=1 Tax=Micromonospora musae TaxID=1894970 RepID=UPI0011C48D9A|nr:DUF2785 domain-containing protein [Micromonospora musae]
MTDWDEIYRSDSTPPAGADLDDLTTELATCLGDADPGIRDGTPHAVLRTWIARDVIAGERRAWLGDQMASRFADPRIEARTFAPLVLDMIVSRGDLRPHWPESFVRWYPAETDLRGHDEKLGWLHAVAHGADLLGTLGRHPEVDPAGMLDVAAARLIAPTDHLYAEREDERLGYAIALTLTRPQLTPRQSLGWLETIEEELNSFTPGITPAHVSNALRTLRMLYLLTHLGVPDGHGGARIQLTHRDSIMGRLAAVLS